MAQGSFSSFISPAPVLEALQPLRRLIQRATQPYRSNDEGRIYLGEGQPVMVFPALGGGPETTASLRIVLAEAGFAPHDWGLGTDTGPGPIGLNSFLRRLEEQVLELFEAERHPVTLLGWGLSGIYAREVSKRMTPLVRQVITLGAPFNTHAGAWRDCVLLRALEGNTGGLDPAVRNRLRQRPPVPCTSIYSLTDHVVPWALCVEVETAHSENIEIPVSGHLELPAHPQVLEVVTHRLAQPQAEWRPFGA